MNKIIGAPFVKVQNGDLAVHTLITIIFPIRSGGYCVLAAIWRWACSGMMPIVSGEFGNI